MVCASALAFLSRAPSVSLSLLLVPIASPPLSFPPALAGSVHQGRNVRPAPGASYLTASRTRRFSAGFFHIRTEPLNRPLETGPVEYSQHRSVHCFYLPINMSLKIDSLFHILYNLLVSVSQACSTDSTRHASYDETVKRSRPAAVQRCLIFRETKLDR